MEYKTITKPDGSGRSSPYMTENAASGWRAFTTACRTLPKSVRRNAVCRSKLTAGRTARSASARSRSYRGETDYGKLEIMADVYLNYLAQVFNLPDDDYVKTRLEFGSDSAESMTS